MAKTINEMIAHLNPCKEVVEWLGNEIDIKKAWNKCNKANWLLWLATYYIDRKIVVLSTCDCAETVLKYIPEYEDRPKKAIDTVRLWAEGRASFEEIRQAISAASDATDAAVNAAYAATVNAYTATVNADSADAADASDANDAADAAHAAADAAHAVFAAVTIAYTAAYADAAVNADHAAYANAAHTTATFAASATNVVVNINVFAPTKTQKRKNLKKLASLVRKRITAEMIEESLLKGTQR